MKREIVYQVTITLDLPDDCDGEAEEGRMATEVIEPVLNTYFDGLREDIYDDGTIEIGIDVDFRLVRSGPVQEEASA